MSQENMRKRAEKYDNSGYAPNKIHKRNPERRRCIHGLINIAIKIATWLQVYEAGGITNFNGIAIRDERWQSRL